MLLGPQQKRLSATTQHPFEILIGKSAPLDLEQLDDRIVKRGIGTKQDPLPAHTFNSFNNLRGHWHA